MFEDYSWNWLKYSWEDLSTVQKVEAFLRTVFFIPARAVIRYRAITTIILALLCGFGISQCDGCDSDSVFDLSKNDVSQSEMEVISEAISCAWSGKLNACFCVYANGGTVGFYAPKESCGKQR